MTAQWTPNELDQIAEVCELRVAVPRPDGSWSPWTPIRVVVADGGGVRPYRVPPHTTGWFGVATRTGHAQIRTPGFDTEVLAEATTVELRPWGPAHALGEGQATSRVTSTLPRVALE
jgi:hypothetical protein